MVEAGGDSDDGSTVRARPVQFEQNSVEVSSTPEPAGRPHPGE